MKTTLEPIEQLTLEVLQLRIGNLQLQVELGRWQLNDMVKQIAAKYGRDPKDLDAQTLTWMDNEP